MSRKLVHEKKIDLRISTEIKEMLEKRASLKNMTISEYIRDLIVKDNMHLNMKTTR